MNKIIKTASAMLIALSMAAPVFAAPADTTDTVSASKFNDINTENYAWAREYINSMAQKGLISGYEDGTFRPDNDVTRLEALSLFARAMGSNDEANSQVLEIAHEKYDAVIKNYDLKWGDDEIAYLMYKGALKKTDLDTYLKDTEKDTPMKRYEAAIIITKAMGGEEKALAELGVVLNYSDAREVPSNAIQYVSYATEAGIMEGMGEGLFSPNTAVKRSQMAVMLSRTVDKTDYSFMKVKLIGIDTDAREISIRNSAGEENKVAYTDDTSIKNMGVETQVKDLDVNVDAVLTFAENT
ncbi:MAG: S-layer homology domain-containing protein, partial [Hominilimicola sp.]